MSNPATDFVILITEKHFHGHEDAFVIAINLRLVYNNNTIFTNIYRDSMNNHRMF